MPDFAPSALHDHLLERAPRILRFDADAYLPEWQSAARRSFKQLLGLMPGKVDLNLRTLGEHPATTARPYHSVEFLFTSEPHVDVLCQLVIPGEGEGPFPTTIFLADSSASFGPLGVEAVQRQHAVLCIIPRAMGVHRVPPDAADPALVALLVGRTLLGECVWDVIRAIDALTENVPAVDASRISILGTGAAGLVAYAAAAIEPRLAAAIVLDGIVPFATLAREKADTARYLPNIMHYFDIADLAGLIAPRPLLLANAATECLDEIRAIYTAQKVPDACVPLSPDATPSDIWNAFDQLMP